MDATPDDLRISIKIGCVLSCCSHAWNDRCLLGGTASLLWTSYEDQSSRASKTKVQRLQLSFLSRSVKHVVRVASCFKL